MADFAIFILKNKIYTQKMTKNCVFGGINFHNAYIKIGKIHNPTPHGNALHPNLQTLI
jgi:hypothetical protein